MEIGEEEGRLSKADDGMANAVMQDEGRKRKRRTWKMSEMREVTRAKMLERMEMSADDWARQERYIQSPDYDKARAGEDEYDFDPF